MFKSQGQTSNFHQSLAGLAAESYAAPEQRKTIGQFKYIPEISTFRTAAFQGPTGGVIAHRGTVPSDAADVRSDGRIALGFLPKEDRLQSAMNVSQAAAAQLRGPLLHTGHSLGGAVAVARKVARDRGEHNVTFNRYTGSTLNRENKQASAACKQGTGGPECHNTTDVYNPGDIAVARIGSDYGRKLATGTATGGPLARHAVAQFQTPQGSTQQEGSGKKKQKRRPSAGEHPQQALLDLAYKHM